MRRRRFIALIVGVGAMAARSAPAQPAGRRRTIGFLGTNTAASWAGYIPGFIGRLRELGWVDGQTVTVEYRWADGRTERFAEIAAEFARLKVDVIVTSGAAVLAIKKATSAIPIVFALANDPVGSGIVMSLARPGGNATGLSLQSPDLAGKRLGLLREAMPRVSHLAVLANAAYPGALAEMKEVEATAGRLDVKVTPVQIRGAEEIVAAVEGLKGHVDALYVCTDPLISTHRVRINALALHARLPTLHSEKQYVEAGGLMSYGPNLPKMFRRAAEYVDTIFKGAKPADLPVEQPTKFELVINLKTAKALGLVIPPSLLLRADQVIE
jgi:putative ABC transport system substrate-binding protein